MLGTYRQAATAVAVDVGDKHAEVLKLLQRAVTKLDAYRRFSEEAFFIAKHLSLHGEERLEKDYISEKEYALTKCIQCIAVDVFGVELHPEEEKVPFAGVNSYEEYFTISDSKLTEKYNELHSISNQLIHLGYEPIACYFKELYHCYWHMLLGVKQVLKEGRMVSWQPHHILIYQSAFKYIYKHVEKSEHTKQ